MKNKILSILLVFVASIAYTQMESANWFFGENAGLTFKNYLPEAITDGSLSTMEACSSISDQQGHLMFYTDGISVWDNTHNLMPHGDMLLGNPSSSQSGIVVARPASDNLYYIFTIDDVAHGTGGSYGINYSLVDMRLLNWKGDVVDTVKNVNLTKPMCEKLAAVGHANGLDTWVITQKWGTNNIYSYLVTNEGVNETPVISEQGQVISGFIDNAKGYMKVSPNGEVLAKANAGMNNVEIFDFNNTTGIVSNARVITDIPGEPYGIEFSPDNKLLYVSSWKDHGGKYLLQYDLEAGSIDDIIASQYIVATGTEGALQIAPDNRIYVAMANMGSLSRVNQPNKIGADCDFEYATVSLGGRTCRWGLPDFISSIFLGVGKAEINSDKTNIISINPNPNKGIFQITASLVLDYPFVTVYDNYSSEVFHRKINARLDTFEPINIDLDFLRAGHYVLLIKTKNNSFTEKLILE
ncbi:MAG: hypothetical protein GXO88_01625 [Chlorobi bacterium]|nr:hypothetical protein [Chlorobiota bacterium]